MPQLVPVDEYIKNVYGYKWVAEPAACLGLFRSISPPSSEVVYVGTCWYHPQLCHTHSHTHTHTSWLLVAVAVRSTDTYFTDIPVPYIALFMLVYWC